MKTITLPQESFLTKFVLKFLEETSVQILSCHFNSNGHTEIYFYKNKIETKNKNKNKTKTKMKSFITILISSYGIIHSNGLIICGEYANASSFGNMHSALEPLPEIHTGFAALINHTFSVGPLGFLKSGLHEIRAYNLDSPGCLTKHELPYTVNYHKFGWVDGFEITVSPDLLTNDNHCFREGDRVAIGLTTTGGWKDEIICDPYLYPLVFKIDSMPPLHDTNFNKALTTVRIDGTLPNAKYFSQQFIFSHVETHQYLKRGGYQCGHEKTYTNDPVKETTQTPVSEITLKPSVGDDIIGIEYAFVADSNPMNRNCPHDFLKGNHTFLQLGNVFSTFKVPANCTGKYSLLPLKYKDFLRCDDLENSSVVGKFIPKYIRVDGSSLDVAHVGYDSVEVGPLTPPTPAPTPEPWPSHEFTCSDFREIQRVTEFPYLKNQLRDVPHTRAMMQKVALHATVSWKYLTNSEIRNKIIKNTIWNLDVEGCKHEFWGKDSAPFLNTYFVDHTWDYDFTQLVKENPCFKEGHSVAFTTSIKEIGKDTYCGPFLIPSVTVLDFSSTTDFYRKITTYTFFNPSNATLDFMWKHVEYDEIQQALNCKEPRDIEKSLLETPVSNFHFDTESFDGVKGMQIIFDRAPENDACVLPQNTAMFGVTSLEFQVPENCTGVVYVLPIRIDSNSFLYCDKSTSDLPDLTVYKTKFTVSGSAVNKAIIDSRGVYIDGPTKAPTQGYKCKPGETFARDPENCAVFYECDPNSGTSTRYECAEGLVFNTKVEVCDWPENTDCSNAKPVSNLRKGK